MLHGIGKHEDVIDTIAKLCVVSLDFLDDDANHAIWKVKEEIKLEKLIKNYREIVTKVNDKYEQVPYGKLDSFVEKTRNIDH